ncbi:fungal-specific transcription factor domain-containing protein [Radiomyces spectabilis]|uniref:fungal-specific transcription factor domain-containing protein n=1 Tax=Radiomyces spectabilis TaxID=64574 RepID=UPI00221E986E|nr:fungal-specific transcription factor domain-containing protein [Radiomyces spectabilis]KAI8391023.1 fungal-specific transcription factor domain-containing protein [Radiomyces spectabilis]
MQSTDVTADYPTENKKKTNAAANSKRLKITRACDECRKRKVKCDGVQPCGRCRKSDADCVFAKQPPKRGLPRQYMELLEARLQLVERALRTIDGPARRILDDALTLNPQRFQDTNTTNDDTTDTTIQEDNRSRGVSSAAPCYRAEDRFLVNEIGQALYVHDYQGRVDRIPSMEDLNGSAVSESSRYSSTAAELSEAAATATASLSSLPMVKEPDTKKMESAGFPGEIPPALLEAYFVHVHKYAPMIHKPSFDPQITLRYDPPSKLLLYAMCAVASRWVADPSQHAPPMPPGFPFYQRAFALIDEYLDVPRVSTIQALVLLTKYQEHYRRLGFFNRSGLFLSIAVRMCNDLGLSRLDTMHEGMSISEWETRKRTFWMTFMYDILTSIEQGREPYFGSVECTTELPQVTNDEKGSLEETVVQYNSMFQLCKILSSIYHMSRRVAGRQQVQANTRTVRQVVEEQGRLFVLHTHLENLLHELPPGLTYVPTQDMETYPAEKHPITDAFVGFFHMTYNFSVILLHRHYVLHPFPDTEFNLQSYEHRSLCAAAASNITNITESLMEKKSRDVFSYSTRGIQHAIHCVAMAATIHRFEMTTCGEGGTNEKAKQQYLKSLHLLNRLAVDSPAIELHSHIKEAELTQLYGQLAVDTSSQQPTGTMASHASSSSPWYPPVATPTASIASSSPSTSHINQSNPSSTSSSPVLSASVDMPRSTRAIKMPKTRRHTMTGPTSTNIMMMAAATNPSTSSRSASQQPALPFTLDVPPVNQANLFSSSASLTDPARFASLMMHEQQQQQRLPLYNHHQQPLITPPTYPGAVNQHAYLRRKPRGLNHHISYSVEDLRARRRADMAKPSSIHSTWPPLSGSAHPPSSSSSNNMYVSPHVVYGQPASSHHAPFPTQEPKVPRLRHHRSMMMMPRHHHSHSHQLSPSGFVAHAGAPISSPLTLDASLDSPQEPSQPPPHHQLVRATSQVSLQDQQSLQQSPYALASNHPRRHSISLPDNSFPFQPPTAPVSHNPCDMLADSQPCVDTSKLNSGSAHPAEDQMMLDPPLGTDDEAMNHFLLSSGHWSSFLNTSSFEDMQRTDHVMQYS